MTDQHEPDSIVPALERTVSLHDFLAHAGIYSMADTDALREHATLWGTRGSKEQFPPEHGAIVTDVTSQVYDALDFDGVLDLSGLVESLSKGAEADPFQLAESIAYTRSQEEKTRTLLTRRREPIHKGFFNLEASIDKDAPTAYLTGRPRTIDGLDKVSAFFDQNAAGPFFTAFYEETLPGGQTRTGQINEQNARHYSALVGVRDGNLANAEGEYTDKITLYIPISFGKDNSTYNRNRNAGAFYVRLDFVNNQSDSELDIPSSTETIPDYNSDPVRHTLHDLAFRYGIPTDAITLINEQMTRAKQDAQAKEHYDMGVIHLNEGRYDDAITCLESVTTLNPDAVDARSALSVAYNRKGLAESDLDRKALLFEQAIEADPHNFKAHSNLGMTEYHRGNLEQALAHTHQALEIMPDYRLAQKNLEKISLRMEAK